MIQSELVNIVTLLRSVSGNVLDDFVNPFSDGYVANFGLVFQNILNLIYLFWYQGFLQDFWPGGSNWLGLGLVGKRLLGAA